MVNFTLRRHSAALLSATLTASALSAQSSPDTSPAAVARDEVVTLDVFTVNETTDRGYQATNAISGSRLNEPIKNVPLSITVITPELLSDLDADTYDAALKFQSSYNPENQRIRGLTAFVNNRNSAGIDGELETAGIDRVEVVKGPATLMYGVTAAGGQVNAISKRANLARNRYTFDAQIGSEDRQRFRADVNQVLVPGKLGTRVNLKTEEYGSPYSDFSTRTADFIQWTSSYRPLPTTVISFEIEANRPDQPLTNAILRTDANTAGQPNSNIPFPVLYGTPEDWEYSAGTARRELDHTIYRIDWEQQWVPGLNSVVTYNLQDRLRKGDATSLTNTSTPPAGGAAGRYLRVNWRDEDYTVEATTFEAMVKYDFGDAAWKHSFLLRFQDRQYDDRSIVVRAPASQDSFVRLTGVTRWDENYARRPANLTFTEVYKNSSIWDNTSDLKQYSASYMPRWETSAGTIRVTYGVVSQKQVKTDRRPFSAANYTLPDPLPVSAIEPSGSEVRTLFTDVQEGTTTLAAASYAPNNAFTVYSVITGSFRPSVARNSFGVVVPARRGETTEWGVKFDNLWDNRLSGSIAHFNTLERNNSRNDPNIPRNTSTGYFLVGSAQITTNAANQTLPLYTYDPVQNSYTLNQTFSVTAPYTPAGTSLTVPPGTYPLVFNPNGPRGDTVAVGRYRSQGWDTEVFFRAFAGFDSILTYSYVDAATEYDTDALQIGRTDSGTAKHTAGLFAKYTFGNGFFQGLNLTAGYRWSTDKVDQYQVIDGRSVLFERSGDSTFAFGARHRMRIGRNEWFAQFNIDEVWAPDRQVGNRSNSTIRYKFDRAATWRLMAGTSF